MSDSEERVQRAAGERALPPAKRRGLVIVHTGAAAAKGGENTET
jgi:hypothetical protein